MTIDFESWDAVMRTNKLVARLIEHRGGSMAKQWWDYDFNCAQSIEAILAAFNAAGPWQWERVDSHNCGQYVKCRRPRELAQVRVYERRQFRSWQPGDREGFYAELEGASEAQPVIDAVFWNLLQAINATNIVEA